MEKTDIKTGLTSREVETRIRKGLVNFNDAPKTKTILQIIVSEIDNCPFCYIFIIFHTAIT